MAQSSVLSQLHQELAILIADSSYVNRQLTINPPKGADSLTRQTVPWCLARGSLLQLFDATSSGSLPGQLDSAYSQNMQGCLGPSCTTGGQKQQLGSIYSHSCSLTAQSCYSLFHLKTYHLAHPPTRQTLSNSQQKVKEKTLCSQFTSAIFTSQISCLKRYQASYHLLPFPPALKV